MVLFDTHCHLNDPSFAQDAETAYGRMLEAEVAHCAVIGYDLDSSRAAAAFAAAHPGSCAAVGIHPEHAQGYDTQMDEIEALLRRPEVRAVGEIGLDYHWETNPSREIQADACIAQMELACRYDLPVCFHVRDSHADMLALMKANRKYLSGGIMHCFSGSWETAQEYLKLGYHISFAGPVTFKNARKLTVAAQRVPLDRLLIETDSPYMAPEPVRGGRNEPAYVRFICAKIAELRGMSTEEVARATTENARKLFRI